MAVQESPSERANWPKRIKLGAVILILVIVLTILFENNENIKFNILFIWHPQVPPSMLLLGTFAVGFVAGALALHFVKKRRAK